MVYALAWYALCTRYLCASSGASSLFVFVEIVIHGAPSSGFALRWRLHVRACEDCFCEDATEYSIRRGHLEVQRHQSQLSYSMRQYLDKLILAVA